MSNPSFVPKGAKDHRLGNWLSILLRGGVYLSIGMLLIGMLLNAFTGQSWIATTDLGSLLSGSMDLRAEPPRNMAELAYGIRHLQSTLLVQAAVLILILLPGFRVAFLFGGFLRQRDWAFAGIAFTVLLIMSMGTLFHFVE